MTDEGGGERSLRSPSDDDGPRPAHPRDGGARSLGWSPARIRIGALAVASSIVTCALLVGATDGYALFSGVTLYLAVTLVALIYPAAITAQVVLGQLLLAGLLLRGGEASVLFAAVGIATVLVTAELLAVVARHDTPLDVRSRRAIPRAGTAATIGAAAFGAAVLVDALPGPTGITAVVLAVLACVALARTLDARR